MKSACLIILAFAILAVSANFSEPIEKDTRFFRPRPWIPLPIPLPRPPAGQCSVPTQGGCLSCGATPGTGPQCGGDISKRAQCYDPTASSPCPADCADNCQPKCDANCVW